MTNNNNITHTEKEKQTARADDSIMDDKLFVMMFTRKYCYSGVQKKNIKRYFSPSHLNSQVMSKRHVCAKLRQVHHKIFNNKIVLLTSLHRI